MADQTRRWGDRALAMPPQDPWATGESAPPASPEHAAGAESLPGSPADQPAYAFQRGVARVNPAKPANPRTESFTAAHEPTGTGWPDDAASAVPRPFGWHLRQLRRGGRWSIAGLLFAFASWGIWAVSNGGRLTTPVILFVLIVAVAVGVFALARLLGRLVWERQLRRVRRTARGAHLVTAVFLVGVGVAYLRQTPWVMDVWRWLAGLV